MIRLSLLVFVLTLLAEAANHVSAEQYAARTPPLKLRELYPPGMSKQAVQAKWGETKPDFFASRPTSGWESYPKQNMAKILIAHEARTGKQIESFERYWGPDGFLSLARCYYYYDSNDCLVDVEWEYMSD